MNITVQTAERLPEPRKLLQLVRKWIERWCWDDIVSQCVPDLSGRRQPEMRGCRQLTAWQTPCTTRCGLVNIAAG